MDSNEASILVFAGISFLLLAVYWLSEWRVRVNRDKAWRKLDESMAPRYSQTRTTWTYTGPPEGAPSGSDWAEIIRASDGKTETGDQQ